jgi:acyl-CoA thioester hydrolase
MTLKHETTHFFPIMTYDIDFAGVVSNLSYVRWLEDLRNLLAANVLPIAAMLQRRLAPALIRTEIDYLAPVRLPDTLTGRMWVAEAGRARYILAAEFTSQASGQLTARARQTGVFVSTETLRLVPLPDEFR